MKTTIGTGFAKIENTTFGWNVMIHDGKKVRSSKTYRYEVAARLAHADAIEWLQILFR